MTIRAWKTFLNDLVQTSRLSNVTKRLMNNVPVACGLAFAFASVPSHATAAPESKQIASANYSPFTGKLTRNKVRLRLQPNLDGQILRELSKDDLLIVVGEDDEFYAVLPPKGIKAYVFRTYILDNTVEGKNVNVRLEPDTESPVIAQLRHGDHVEGVISPLNSKWLEITPPASARFFVCKEYVDNIGSADMLAKIEKRREEVNSLLNSTHLISQSELQKPFEQIHLENVFNNLDKIAKLYSDFPDQVARAKEMLARIQEIYTQKKIAYLEAKTALLEKSPQNSTTNRMRIQSKKLNEVGQSLDNVPVYASVEVEQIKSGAEQNSLPPPLSINVDWNQTLDEGSKSEKMLEWIPIERNLYESWSLVNNNQALNDYYQQQLDQAVIVKGIIEPYHRNVKNKPGNYLLVSKATNLPMAYLYSTQIELQDHVGQEITMRVASRPNNHFAFPAYFVLTAE